MSWLSNLRRLALSDLAQATCGTIRRKLLKIGALVTISVRPNKLAMASGCPYKSVFAQAGTAPCPKRSCGARLIETPFNRLSWARI